jgi:hypothetical protein
VNRIPPWLRYLAVAGDVAYILWIVRNGMESGFRGTPVEVVSFVGLIVLLALNAGLLLPWRSAKG